MSKMESLSLLLSVRRAPQNTVIKYSSHRILPGCILTISGTFPDICYLHTFDWI